jgi:hypothetical protein
MLEQSGSSALKARAGKGGKCGLARNLHVQLKTQRFELDRKTRKLPPVLCFQTRSPAASAGGEGRHRGAAKLRHGWWRYLPGGCAQVVRAGAHRGGGPPPAWSFADGVMEAAQGRRARVARAHRCTGPSRTTPCAHNGSITFLHLAFSPVFRILHKNGSEPIRLKNRFFPSKKPESA